ncbi:K+-transporting ATPase ATPase A chain [Desulfurella multipotens]|uniref:Potassium-transporting ATPase potassium-binding subunit n=2 Tax=Desulfurella TaxID=33001 RepID=A0A1G6HYH4_9BACT|nr:potassium-transporting ATPase subunit KdpA [Desulfurella multipotens]SDB99244.1 K+-transporting ATPase ATPase A chain [Desulfurella multipotens]
MPISDIIQFLVFIVLVSLLVKPLGSYMANVFNGEKTVLSLVFRPIEIFIYKIANIDETYEMNWKEFAISMLIFNAIGFVVLFLILVLQQFLPLNPQHFKGFNLDLAFNTAVSFITNTNWQAYSGENTASYFTQMLGLAVQNFLSAVTGIVVLLALIRGFTRKQTTNLGNFWVDSVRTTLYILLPLSVVAAVILMSQGVIQNFSSYKTVHLLEPYINAGKVISNQVLPMGPVVSQEAIKLLGTNGGGFFGANSAHPFENPNGFTNFFEAFLIILIPAALTYTFGSMIKNKKQGWAIYLVMLTMFVVFLGIEYTSSLGNDPLISRLGVTGHYIEGQEVRFGIGGTSLFATTTTAVACGAVDAMHDSLLPISGMVPTVLMLLSEVVFGGVGSGLYTMIAFIIIAVFVAGLMIGRTPEFLGKKIEVKEMWMAIIVALTSGILVLIFTTIAFITKAGVSSILNPGPHGLSEILYAFASTANNNGSAFAGLNADTVFYNITTAIAMLIGRYIPAVAIIYMSGALAQKKYTPPSVGTLPTDKVPFMVWLILVILIVGALTFFSALALGPFLENILMLRGA